MAEQKQKSVAYFYDEELANYNYGGGNPMRPHRVRLTTNLVSGYGLTNKMQLLRPVARTREEIMLFHADGECATFAMARGQPPGRQLCTGQPGQLAARPPAHPCATEPHPRPPADYVDFLNSVTPENQEEFMMQMRRFNLGPVGEADCPVFDGMFEYFRVRLPSGECREPGQRGVDCAACGARGAAGPAGRPAPRVPSV